MARQLLPYATINHLSRQLLILIRDDTPLPSSSHIPLEPLRGAEAFMCRCGCVCCSGEPDLCLHAGRIVKMEQSSPQKPSIIQNRVLLTMSSEEFHLHWLLTDLNLSVGDVSPKQTL